MIRIGAHKRKNSLTDLSEALSSKKLCDDISGSDLGGWTGEAQDDDGIYFKLGARRLLACNVTLLLFSILRNLLMSCKFQGGCRAKLSSAGVI